MPVFNEPRAFMVGRPLMRISDSTTHDVRRIINWHEEVNDFLVTDYSWPSHEQAPWDEADDGYLYDHVDGNRLHCGLRFSYRHPDYTPGHVPQHETFTEWDYRWVMMAKIGIEFDIEFFPFDTIPMGTTPPNLNYLVKVAPGSPTRTRNENNAYKWDCFLEVYGKQVRTSVPHY